MSLGGIAIAIGAMVDAAVVMIENAHKHLERWGHANPGEELRGEKRWRVIGDAAAEVGPIIAGKGKAERAALRSYGTNLGLAFQLVDDALDYGGSAADLGKNVGDDFREGKVTLPVILAYRRGTMDERAFWKRAIEGGESDDKNLEIALGCLQRHSAIADTIQRARHYGEIARDALAPLPAGMHKDAMVEVIDFCISRVV